jgi:hypothetical protein
VGRRYITEISLLSNSKVQNVIHSGRITFRVLANYIPRFGELHSAVMAHCKHSALPSGAAAGGRRPAPEFRTASADYNSSPAGRRQAPCGGTLPPTCWGRLGSPATSAVRLLKSATRCGPGCPSPESPASRGPSAAASASATEWPPCHWPACQSVGHWGASHWHAQCTRPLVDLPARQETKQPRKGRPVVSTFYFARSQLT